MAGPDPMESRPPNNVHTRPSPLEERPPQRMRREDESQITRLGLYGQTHFVSHPPFTPSNSTRSVPYDMLVQDAKEVDLEGNDIGQAAGSGTMPIESSHNTRQTNPAISEDDQQVDQLIASCDPIREGAFDDLGAILASYQPGYSDGTGLDANGSGNPTQQFQGATGSTPQMATQQAADWSWSERVSSSSSFSLACSQRYTNFQANPYYFKHSAQSCSSSSAQYGFTNISPSIAGPSTTNYTSITSYPQSGSFSYYPNAGSGSYLNPPNTSSMARSLSTSDIPPMAPVPGDFSSLTASTSGSWTYAQAQYAFTASQISSVNALPDNPRLAPGMTTSHDRGHSQFPASGECVSSLPQSGTTCQAPTLLSVPARLPPYPMRQGPRPSTQTAGTIESRPAVQSRGPVAEGGTDPDGRTLEEETRWIDRNLSLATLMQGMRLQCSVRGQESVQAMRDLRALFREMSDLCYDSVRRTGEEINHVSHRSMVR